MQEPAIDAARWPHVATVPHPRFAAMRMRRAETAFATACTDLTLEGGDPDLTIHVDHLFARVADSGWVGFAESYLAGEWDSPRLPQVLAALLRAGWAPRTRGIAASASDGGEVPADLTRIYNPDPFGHHGGIFSSGVPTTVRTSVQSYAPGPKTHFVDVTHVSEPTNVDRADLGSALERGAEWLLDAAHVGPGTHALVFPLAGAQVAVQAAARQGIVDVLTADEDAFAAAQEHFLLAGVGDSIHLELADAPIPHRRRGRYDAVVSVSSLDNLNARERAGFFGAVERLLAPTGRAVIQTGVATEKFGPAARGALEPLRAYIWPNLTYTSTNSIHRLADKTSRLRIIAQVHTGDHYRETLAQQRSFFEGRHREAAAAGFDNTYRRLWNFQLALREALIAEGMVDVVHLTAVHRDRGGRR